MKRNLSAIFMLLGAAAFAARIAFSNHDLSALGALLFAIGVFFYSLHRRENRGR